MYIYIYSVNTRTIVYRAGACFLFDFSSHRERTAAAAAAATCENEKRTGRVSGFPRATIPTVCVIACSLDSGVCGCTCVCVFAAAAAAASLFHRFSFFSLSLFSFSSRIFFPPLSRSPDPTVVPARRHALTRAQRTKTNKFNKLSRGTQRRV